MAHDGLISAYLRELHYSIARMPDADDIVDEARDHLLEATERLVAGGRSRVEAEHEAMARFGSAALIARVCASEAKRTAAVPTMRTRRAGLALFLSPVLLIVGQWLNVAIPSQRGSVHGIGLVMLVAAFPAFLYGLWGLRARHGGLGRFGSAAIVLALLAPILSMPAGWGIAAALAGWLCLALTVFAVQMLRAGVLPIVPLVLVAAGPIGCLLAAGVANATSGADGELVLVPFVITIAGIVWLGWHLWREAAVDGTRSGHAFA